MVVKFSQLYINQPAKHPKICMRLSRRKNTYVLSAYDVVCIVGIGMLPSNCLLESV